MKRTLGIFAITALLLTGCSTTSENAEACTAYETAFNTVTGAVAGQKAGTVTSAEVLEKVEAQTAEILAARETATGKVSAAIGESSELNAAMNAGSDDAGMAFYIQAPDVAEACGDAGTDITLR